MIKEILICLAVFEICYVEKLNIISTNPFDIKYLNPYYWKIKKEMLGK